MSIMLEWGITYEEYMNTPAHIIGTIQSYKQAEGEGNKRLNAKQNK